MFKVNLTFTFTPDLVLRFFRKKTLCFFCLPVIANALPIQGFCFWDEAKVDNLFLQDGLADVNSLSFQANEVKNLSGNRRNMGINP
jgi:hypothetical protein